MSKKSRFSFFRMFITFIISAILVAIAIPIIGRINDQVEIAKKNRNAQAIVTMGNAAASAGHSFGAKKSSAIIELLEGIKVINENSEMPTIFQLDLDQDDAKDAAQNIKFENGVFTLTPQ